MFFTTYEMVQFCFLLARLQSLQMMMMMRMTSERAFECEA